MSEIIHLNEDKLKGQLSKLVRGTVEETLNKLLDEEADRMTGANRHPCWSLYPSVADKIRAGINQGAKASQSDV